jgi:hypothetical protein
VAEGSNVASRGADGSGAGDGSGPGRGGFPWILVVIGVAVIGIVVWIKNKR